MLAKVALVGQLVLLCTLAAPQPVEAAGPGVAPNDVVAQQLVVPPSVPQITQAINPAQLTPMQTNVRPEVVTAIDRGLVADSLALDHMLLLLHRPETQAQALEKFMTEQTTLGSPNYHHWLTAEQVGEYGPAQSDIDAITSWLQAQGFLINRIHGDRVSIDFSGTAGQVRQTFKTEIHSLDVDGATHIANISVPKIPAALAPAVIGIVSLNDFRPHTNVKQLSPDYTVSSSAQMIVPADLATIYNLRPLFNAGIDGTGQTIVLLEEEDPYNTVDGVNADINAFRSTFGLPAFGTGPTYTEIHPGNCIDPGNLNDGIDSEVEADIEWAGASAPRANLVMASCADTTTYGVMTAMLNLNSANDSAELWNISYSLCEAAGGAAVNAAFSSAYQTAAARGVSVFVASGDDGAAGCDPGQPIATHGIGVSGWTSTPYNVSVGGTDFGDTFAGTTASYWNPSNTATFGSAKSYINEIPLNESCASALISSFEGFANAYGAAGFCNSVTGNAAFLTTRSGGGGPSGCATGTATVPNVVSGTCAGTPKPSWQSVTGNPADGVRDVPDVSLFAGGGVWGHSYVFCWSNPVGGGSPCSGAPSGWSRGGGTSIASPIMAGIQALVNQKTNSSQGNPNPTYYALAAEEYGSIAGANCYSSLGNGVASSCIFYDVTQGDMDVNCIGTNNCYFPPASPGTNGVLSTSNTVYQPSFGAGSGWDFATGIGTVNAANLVKHWPTAQVASSLAFTTQPAASYASGATITVSVSVQNASGAVITTNTSPVTIAMSGGTGGATLSGTRTQNAVAGVATFTLTVDKAGTGYTLTGSSSALGGATSNAFNITAGPAAKLVFTGQPPATSVVGAGFGATLSVEDNANNLVTTDTSSVTVALTTPGGATLSGTKTVAAVGGAATFSGLSVDTVGTYTLTATDTGLTSAISSSFNVGPASQTVTFTSPSPTTASVGSATYTPTAAASSGLPVVITIDPAASGVCTISAGVVSFVGGGSCVIDANQGGNNNFSAAPQVQQSFIVGPGSQTITFPNPGPVTYAPGRTFALGATASSGLPASYVSNTTGVCTVSGSTATIVTAGSCSITASQAGDTNYSAATPVTDLITINKAPQKIDFPNPGPVTYSAGGTIALSASSSSGLTLSYVSNSTGVCTVSGSTATIVAAGSCSITASQAGDTNYKPAISVTDSIVITLANQTITFPNPGPVTYAPGRTFALGATASSALPASYVSNTTGVCTVSGSTATVVTAGSCSITASQAGDTNYSAATPVTDLVTINKAPQKIDFPNPGPVTYSASGTIALSASSSSGLTVSYVSNSTGVCTVSGSTATIVTAGNCSITASQAGDTNYSAARPVTDIIAINTASQTITFPNPGPVTYAPGRTFALGATASSGLPASYVSNTTGVCTVSGSTATVVTAGSCSITASQAGDANYSAATPVTDLITINKAPQKIDFPNPGPVTYSAAGTIALSASSSSGLTVSYVSNTTGVCTVSGSTATIATAGSCSITASQAGDANYKPAISVTDSIVITKASQTITFSTSAPTGEFVGGPTYTPAATASSGLPVAFSIDAGSNAGACTISAGVVSFTGAGTCIIDADQSGDSNYSAAPRVQQSVPLGMVSQTVSFTSSAPSGATAGGTYIVTATASSGLPVALTIDALAASVCSLSASSSGATVTYNGVGTCTIDADQSGNANYSAAAQVQQSFGVAPGAAAALNFTVQPSDTTAGLSINPGVQVSLVDAFGNLETGDSTHTITLMLTAGTDPSFSGGGPITLSNGVATFPAVTLTKAASGYQVGASTSAGAFTATSNAFRVNPASVVSLAFNPDPPSGAVAGFAIPGTETITEFDQYRNVVTTDNSSTISVVANGPGSLIATPATAPVSYGVATIVGEMVLEQAGSYTLTASTSASALASATSQPFTVSAASGNTLQFTRVPGDIQRGQSLGQVTVTEYDGFGNPVLSDNSTSITLTAGSCGGTPLGAGVLTGGVVTIATTLEFRTLANGVSLTASAAGSPAPKPATSTFNVGANDDFVFISGFEACTP